jgi:hypothetical protein
MRSFRPTSGALAPTVCTQDSRVLTRTDAWEGSCGFDQPSCMCALRCAVGACRSVLRQRNPHCARCMTSASAEGDAHSSDRSYPKVPRVGIGAVVLRRGPGTAEKEVRAAACM